MSIAALREQGAPQLLDKAIVVLKERGQAFGVTYDYSNGSVDALGALCIAAGAKSKHLTDEPTRCGVPQAKAAILLYCVDALEYQYGNIASWSDRSSPKEICAAFRNLRDRIQIAVI